MIDDYAEFLTNEAASSNAAVHEFLTSYNEGGSEIHAFFEGDEDFIYYLPLIRLKSKGAEIISYNCGGKWNVAEARDTITERYNVAALFFVDRDYDDHLNRQARKTECLYITDGYSIESSLSDDAALHVALRDVLTLPKTDADRLYVDIQKRLVKVKRRLRCISAWILASKESGCKPNLNNTNSLNGIVTVSPDGDLQLDKVGFTKFKRKVYAGTEPSHADHVKWHRLTSKSDDFSLIRGKYQAWIFCKAICLALHDENINRAKRGAAAVRIPEAISSSRIVELLGGRVPYPISLTTYLESQIPKHLRAA